MRRLDGAGLSNSPLHRQHQPNFLLLIVVHQGFVTQIALAFGGFFRQDVTVISALSLDMTFGGGPVPFFDRAS